MFTYFLVGEDSSQRQQRLSSSVLSYTPDRLAANDRCDTATVPDDAVQEPVKPGSDRGWSAGPGEPRRPPPLPRCEHGRSCDLASDLAMESIFPNFRRSLMASSKRRRFRQRSAIDAVMSNSLQDCTVHDATAIQKENGVVGSIVRQKDFRIPKSSILESASEGEFRVIQMPPGELEEDGLINEVGWTQGSTDEAPDAVV